MSNVIHLNSTPNHIKSILETILKENESGEIDSLVICGTKTNGDILCAIVMDENSQPFSLIGQLENVKLQLLYDLNNCYDPVNPA